MKNKLYMKEMKENKSKLKDFRESLYLEGQIVVLLLLVGPQSVPPLPQDLADCPVVLVGVSLVHQGAVAFAEDHECVHGAADVVLLPLVGFWKRTGCLDIYGKL